MSVVLENVTKYVPSGGRRRALFSGLNLEIREGARIGVLALPKSGKTSLVQLICGMLRPDAGRVHRNLAASWALPAAQFLVAHSSVAWNIRSIGRMFGIRDKAFAPRIAELGGLTEYMNIPLQKCPVFVRQQLGFALGIGLDFELYVFDNLMVPVAEKDFKDRGLAALRQRTEGKSVFLATSAPQNLMDFCDEVHVLEGGKLIAFPAAKEAVDHFKSLQKAAAEAEKERRGRGEEGEPDALIEEDARGVDLVQAGLADIL